MNRKTRASKPTLYGVSKTKPGQALIPAELLKRHLAGTLPDIQHTPQFTHDENGQQISEDLSGLELHELHDLSMRLHSEFKKREAELAVKHSEKLREDIINQYIKSQTAASKEAPVGTAAASASETEQEGAG